MIHLNRQIPTTSIASNGTTSIIRHWLMKVVLSVGVFFIHGTIHAQWGDSQAISDAKNAVVTVVTYDAAGDVLGQGTGFFVGMWNDLITNQHVLAGAESAKVITKGGDTLAVERLLYLDNYGDLVRVSVDAPAGYGPSLKMRTKLPTEGEAIVVVGSPGGAEQTMTYGHVVAIRQLPNFGDIIQIDAKIEPGSSGSPVLDTLGRVLGVATFILPDGDLLGFAMPASRVTGLRKKNRIDRPINDLGETLFGLYKPVPNVFVGYAYYWAGDYSTALDKAELAVEDSPNEPLGLMLLGGCYHKLDSLAKAIMAFECAATSGVDVANLVCGELAPLYTKVGKLEEAAVAWEQYIDVDPENGKALEAMGAVLGTLGRNDEAVVAFRRATELLPRSHTAFIGLGTALFNLEKYSESITVFQSALQADSSSAKSYRMIGAAKWALGHFEQAFESYKNAIRKNPGNPKTYIELGYWQLEFGNFLDASTLFNKAIQLDSGSAVALCGLGNAYNQMERYAEAILPFSNSIAIDSSIAEAHGGLGYAHYNMRQLDLAVLALENAIQCNPKYGFGRMLLAWIYHREGDVDSAMQQYESLKNFDPDSAAELLKSFTE